MNKYGFTEAFPGDRDCSKVQENAYFQLTNHKFVIEIKSQNEPL